jgi:nitric oxide reductase NorQ protein
LEFDFPEPSAEAEIVRHESQVKPAMAKALVELARRVRRLKDQGLTEGPGTRLLVSAGRLIADGIPPADACQAAVIGPLTDDPDLLTAIGDLVAATF